MKVEDDFQHSRNVNVNKIIFSAYSVVKKCNFHHFSSTWYDLILISQFIDLLIGLEGLERTINEILGTFH